MHTFSLYALRLCGLLLLALALGGCSLHSLVPGWHYASPGATVRAFSQAATSEDATDCFPDSWPEAERWALADKVGASSSQRIVSITPTRFAGEPLAVYGKASVVVDAKDMEVVQEIVRPSGSIERWWYLLRDCGGQWKILALYKNSGQ